MQRNRSYNRNQDWEDQRSNQSRDQYPDQDPFYPNLNMRPEHGQRGRRQFPDDDLHHYPQQRHHEQDQYGRQGNRGQGGQQQNWQQEDYRQSGRQQGNRQFDRDNERGQRQLDPSAYRGAYRLDTDRENRDEYRQLDRENFGPDYGYGHAGNSRTGGDRGRDQSDHGNASSYAASRNAGSMGSYGGAQGFGSARNGSHSEDWASGHGTGRSEKQHQIYGAYRDKNSFAAGESESYDGTQRYGSQGADNTRGWVSSGRSGNSGSYRRSNDEDDSRYEIYDSAQAQYNRGDYGNSTNGSISDDLNLRSHQNYPPSQRYGSKQRGSNRQGSGNDQDRYSGTSDMGYNNTAGSLSIGYDGYRGEAEPRHRRYDPLTGDTMNPGT